MNNFFNNLKTLFDWYEELMCHPGFNVEDNTNISWRYNWETEFQAQRKFVLSIRAHNNILLF